MRNDFDVLVLGGGAAGLMCAIEAGKRGRRVGVLERADRVGKKILISGGGRCNFTNLHCKPENFLSANPHFCKSALARYTPADFIALVKKYKIAFHEKTLGQLFCDGSAREVVEMLLEECRLAKVEIFLNVAVDQVAIEDEPQRAGKKDSVVPEKNQGCRFLVRAGEDEFRGESLVVATGGLSIPKIGATAFGYDIARRFGLKIVPCEPGLVPLTFNAKMRSQFGDLAGVSCDVIASCEGQSFREKMLFTHRGLSGPAILQISSYWQKGRQITIDVAPVRTITQALGLPGARRDIPALRAALRANLPQRLGDRWLELHTIKEWTNAGLDEWEADLHRWEFMPDGTEGFEKAEVTAGGVDTGELSSKTMESRRVPGLYFVGEVVDVTGQLGGFNFQWAWASGHAAGQAV
jgi:predicted Rossmann fold flavoprotein